MDRARCATNGSVLRIISKATPNIGSRWSHTLTNMKYFFEILIFKSHRDRGATGFSTDSLTNERIKERKKEEENRNRHL